MFNFKKVYCLLSVTFFTTLPVFSAINANSLNLANNNAPKWQGIEIFKHLNDYKTVNAEDYYMEGNKDFPALYVFKTFSKENVCDMGVKANDDFGHDMSCYSIRAHMRMVLNPTKSQKYTSGSELYADGFYASKPIKTLSAGEKIFLPKASVASYKQQISDFGYPSGGNVSLTCVSAKDENVACRNSNNHGFVTEGAKITTF